MSVEPVKTASAIVDNLEAKAEEEPPFGPTSETEESEENGIIEEEEEQAEGQEVEAEEEESDDVSVIECLAIVEAQLSRQDIEIIMEPTSRSLDFRCVLSCTS